MNIKKIPFGTVDKFHVVVEIPKGSGVKYEYNEKMRVPEAKFFWRDGLVLPYNYGFVPETAAEDGDHLDAIILCDQSIAPGAVVECVAVGVLKLLDRGIPDHKIIAVPAKHALASTCRDVEDVPAEKRQEIIDTLLEMARQKEKIVEIQGFLGKKEAEREIESAHQRFEKEKAAKFF